MGSFSGRHHTDAAKAKLARRAAASWQNPAVRAKRSAAISRSWTARRARMLDAVDEGVANDGQADVEHPFLRL
jgi:hypothetical protein